MINPRYLGSASAVTNITATYLCIQHGAWTRRIPTNQQSAQHLRFRRLPARSTKRSSEARGRRAADSESASYTWPEPRQGSSSNHRSCASGGLTFLQFTLQGTNTFIIGTGKERLIIDTGQGIPEWADLIASTLTSFGIKLTAVLLTHWHGDHTGGVPDLLRLYPELGGSIYKNLPSKTQQPIYDGQLFEVEGATIRAVHTPGHSDDHMCFVLEEEQAL
jgi:hypothetical protein